MSVRSNKRVWVALALTLAAVAWAAWTDPDLRDDPSAARSERSGRIEHSRPGDEPALVAMVAPAAPSGTAAVHDGPVGPAPTRPAPTDRHADLFAAYSWQPPPPAPSAPVKPAPPPLPFVYAGRMVDGANTQFLLVEGVRVHTVAVGAEIGEFSLESAAATQLSFLHRPTGERVLLAISP